MEPYQNAVMMMTVHARGAYIIESVQGRCRIPRTTQPLWFRRKKTKADHHHKGESIFGTLNRRLGYPFRPIHCRKGDIFCAPIGNSA